MVILRKDVENELLRKGTIKAIKVGKLYRIPKINVIAFLTKNTV